MAYILFDVMANLQKDRRRMLSSMERMAKTAEANKKIQARILASVDLIERARAKWQTSAPTLPKPTETSPEGDT